MNCYSAKELADSFRTVRKNTLVIAQDLPEEKYSFRPAPDTRSPGEKWAGWLQGLTDDFLAETVQMAPGMTPPSKSRFEMILSVKEHEMHHRGQLMLIERLLGIVPHLTREMQSRLAGAAVAAKP